jgi:DNA mismatch repair protein MutH
MPLKVGDISASDGMTKAIYDKLQEVMAPIPGISGNDMERLREEWRKLSYAIAHGVVEHIKANMEIVGIKTKGDVITTVTGSTGMQSGVEFTQSNDGTGHVK